jgi:hypothetical protein
MPFLLAAAHLHAGWLLLEPADLRAAPAVPLDKL